jgi:hypothetical protein
VSSQNYTGLVRAGILALPVSGLLTLAGTVGNLLLIPNPQVDPAGAARVAGTTGFFAMQFASNVLGVTLLIFGLIALFGCLMNTRGGRLASFAMVFSISGVGIFLSFLGVSTYAVPALAKVYLNGEHDVMRTMGAIFGQAFAANGLASLLFLVGSVLFGVAIWRSGTLPKWAGVLLVISGLFVSVPLPIPGQDVVGWGLLMITGGWLASNVLRQPSAQAAQAEAQPRVT